MSSKTMSSSDYNNYLSAIKSANDAQDKNTLARIKSRIIAEYGLDDNDVIRLLDTIRYNV